MNDGKENTTELQIVQPDFRFCVYKYWVLYICTSNTPIYIEIKCHVLLYVECYKFLTAFTRQQGKKIERLLYSVFHMPVFICAMCGSVYVYSQVVRTFNIHHSNIASQSLYFAIFTTFRSERIFSLSCVCFTVYPFNRCICYTKSPIYSHVSIQGWFVVWCTHRFFCIVFVCATILKLATFRNTVLYGSVRVSLFIRREANQWGQNMTVEFTMQSSKELSLLTKTRTP